MDLCLVILVALKSDLNLFLRSVWARRVHWARFDWLLFICLELHLLRANGPAGVSAYSRGYGHMPQKATARRHKCQFRKCSRWPWLCHIFTLCTVATKLLINKVKILRRPVDFSHILSCSRLESPAAAAEWTMCKCLQMAADHKNWVTPYAWQPPSTLVTTSTIKKNSGGGMISWILCQSSPKHGCSCSWREVQPKVKPPADPWHPVDPLH